MPNRESPGLVPEARAALRNCVLEAQKLWGEIPPTDLWRVYRPTANGAAVQCAKGGVLKRTERIGMI